MVSQQEYQAAMNDAADAAWNQDWERAITAYSRAIKLAPNDSQALAGLALSLMEAGRHQDALKTYMRVSQLVPGDPLPVEKMGEIYQRLGQQNEAANNYLAVAEIYFGRKDVLHAVPNWEKAVQLNPDLPQAYIRLGAIYERDPKIRRHAILAYISLARLLQQHNQLDRAEQSLQRALGMDATDGDARAAMDNLKQGRPIPRVDSSYFTIGTKMAEAQIKAGTGPLKLAADDSSDTELEVFDTSPADDGRSPADEAAHVAMSALSDMIWSGEVPAQAQMALVQAIDLHQVGDASGAIEMYQMVMNAGVNHPALLFNLGLLYQYAGKNNEAVNMLTQVADSEDYTLASSLALGQIYLSSGEVKQAARHLVVALQEADRRTDPVIDTDGYQRLKAGLGQRATEQLTDLSRGIYNYLNDRSWERKLGDTRNGYKQQGKDGYVPDLLELVMEGGKPVMAQIMERVDLYIGQDKFRLAMEEIQHAIEKDNTYLPAHRRMADVMIKEGRTQAAAEKINLIANTYLIRENAERAADLFAEVLAIWPTDMVARQRVIDMMKQQGRVGQALHHYAEMADQYYRVRFDQMKAIEVYNEALQFGETHNAQPQQLIPILKALADIENQQLNWQEAVKYLQRCKDLMPEDETVVMAVVDLHFQMGNSANAIRELDDFIRVCITRGEMDKIITTLEKQVRLHANEAALRQRLGQVYQRQERIPEAIAQLDAAGEMLLQSGQIDEAVATIKSIIALNPPDAEGYHQLLAQLGIS